MQIKKKLALCAVVCLWLGGLAPARITAQSPPDVAAQARKSAQNNLPGVVVLTRSQMSRIARAQRDVDRLTRDLASARKRLLALQFAAVPPANRAAGSPVGGAAIASMTGITALTLPTNTIGFEVDDTVAFVRPDAARNVTVTGIGTVIQVFPDNVTLVITAKGNGIEPWPEDRAYIISRADSVSSLARYFDRQNPAPETK